MIMINRSLSLCLSNVRYDSLLTIYVSVSVGNAVLCCCPALLLLIFEWYGY
jgi:hypothetical protein